MKDPAHDPDAGTDVEGPPRDASPADASAEGAARGKLGPLVSVILPTFNERANIEPLIRRLAEALSAVSHEILVMDDRSADGTAEVARGVAGELQQVRVIERDPPKGLTVSIRDGVEAAEGRYITWMDCDLSHPPELVTDLLEPLVSGNAEISLASRYAPGGEDARDSALTRWYSALINWLSQRMIDRRVRDYTSGYVMAPRELVLELGLHGDYGEYCIQLLGTAALQGVRILEVPYRMTSRIAGESKTVPSLRGFVGRGWKYLKTVGRLWWRKRTIASS